MISTLSVPLPASKLGPDHPFPGLRPFDEEDAVWFFGRGQEINDLLKRLRRVRFLAVVGPSGCGKSSLVRAGLLAAVRDGYLDASWNIATFRPGEQPVRNLAVAASWSAAASDHENTLKILKSGPMGLVEALKERHSGDTNTLLVVDQFEELFQFVQRQGDPAQEEAKAFLKLLLTAAASDAVPVYVVITMRLEWLSECATYIGVAEAINQGLYLVPQMSRRQFQQTILNPIEAAQGRITAALLDRMLNDLDARTDQLPVLEHALMRMWARCRRGEQLDLPVYQEIGTLANCLSDHAEEIYTGLKPEEQFAAEPLFRSITQVSKNRRVRRPRPLGEICTLTGMPPANLKTAVEAFREEGRSFLMTTPGPLTEASVIDLSHEALIRQWGRLGRWTDDEADAQAKVSRLEDIAAEWDRGGRQDKSLLYRGSALRKARELRGRLASGSSGLVFLDASQTADFWNRFFWRASLISIVLILVTAAVGWGLVFVRDERTRATEQTKLAEFASRQASLDQQYQKWVLQELNQNHGNDKVTALVSKLQGKRVYLQCVNDAQVDLAKQVQTALASAGYLVPGWEKVGAKAPNQTQVRFFHTEDRDNAAKLSGLVNGLVTGGVTVQPIAGNQGNLVPVGQFEVWLSPSATAAVTKRE